MSVGHPLRDTRSSFVHPRNTSAGTDFTRVPSAESETSAVSRPHALGKASIPTFPSTFNSVSLEHPATCSSPPASRASSHVSRFLDRSSLVSLVSPPTLFGSARTRLSLNTSSSSRTRSPIASGTYSILFFSRRRDLSVVILHRESGRRVSTLDPSESFVTEVSFKPTSPSRSRSWGRISTRPRTRPSVRRRRGRRGSYPSARRGGRHSRSTSPGSGPRSGPSTASGTPSPACPKMSA